MNTCNLKLVPCISGNSAYGRCLLCAEGQKDIKFLSSQDSSLISREVNRKQFAELVEHDEHTVEISSLRTMTRLNMPVHIGFWVLEHAKLLLLRFYYDFLLKYIDKQDFVLVQMDTDSIYAGFGQNTLYQCVKRHLRAQFVVEFDKWMVKSYCETHKRHFLSVHSQVDIGNNKVVAKELKSIF